VRARDFADLPWGLAVFGIAAGVYANAMPEVAIHDDPFFVPARYTLSADSLRAIFSDDAWAAVGARSGLYRPLTIASIALDGALWGDAAAAYHRTNVLLHALASVAVFVFVRTLCREVPAWCAALGAAAFAVHPIHTEAVDSVFNRSEILVALCIVPALTVLARTAHTRPRLGWTIVACLFLVGLACRESAIALPPLAVLMLWIAQPGGPWRPSRRTLAPLVLLTFVFGAYLALRHGALAGGPSDPSPFFGAAPPTDLAGRVIYSLAQLCEYVRMMLWPWPLRVSYEDFTGQAFRIAVGVHGAALAVALAGRRRAPRVTFAIAFFYTALLPVTQLAASAGGKVQLGAFSLDRPLLPLLVNERVAYLPSVALALLAAVGVAALAQRGGRALSIGCAVVPIAAGAYLTWNRNLAWHESVSLYEAEVKAAPENGDGWRHLIAEYSSLGRLDEGATACDAQMGRDFRSAYFFINCGVVYYQLNRNDDAMRAYRRAIELGLPAVGHVNLARVLARQGKSVEAEAELVAAAEAETNPVLRHFRRGQWLTRFHPDRRAEAIDEYRKALELQPNYAPAQNALQRLRP